MATITQSRLPQIKKYYYKMGWSMAQIAHACAVDLNAVCYFMRKNNLKRRSRTETNQLRFQNKSPSFFLRKKNTKAQEKLWLLGVVLYWAEGGKRSRVVDFANSDVEMCQLFIRFLREICGIDERKLRIYLYCHENQTPHVLMTFWSKRLSVPKTQFTKPYIKRRDPLTKGKINERMLYGLVHIRYGDLKLLHCIKDWIEEISMGRFQSGQMGQTVKRQPSMETSG